MILILLLSTFTITQQLPSNTPKNQVVKHGPRNAKEKAANSEQQPHHNSAVANIADLPSAPQSGSATQQANTNSDAEPYRVKIVSQPTPTDSAAFLIYVCLTGLATIFNLAILIAIVRQNKINWRQAKINLRAARSADRGARAARENVVAFQQGQRAQISVIPRNNVVQDARSNRVAHLKLEIINKGPTPAYECTYETWTEIMPDPFTDFSADATHGDKSYPNTLYSNTAGQIHTFGLRRQLLGTELAELNSGKKVLCFRMLLEYRDAFGNRRYQNFGFAATPEGMAFLPRYNDSN